MVLQKSNIEIPIMMSPDQITDDKITENLSAITNGRFIKKNALTKINGYTGIDQSNTYTGLNMVASFKENVFLNDNSGFRIFNEATNKVETIERSPLPFVSMRVLKQFGGVDDIFGGSVSFLDQSPFYVDRDKKDALLCCYSEERLQDNGHYYGSIIDIDGNTLKRVQYETGIDDASLGNTNSYIGSFVSNGVKYHHIVTVNPADSKLYARKFNNECLEVTANPTAYGDWFTDDLVKTVSTFKISNDLDGTNYCIAFFNTAGDLKIYKVTGNTTLQVLPVSITFSANDYISDFAVCANYYILAIVNTAGTCSIKRIDRSTLTVTSYTPTTPASNKTISCFINRISGANYYIYQTIKNTDPIYPSLVQTRFLYQAQNATVENYIFYVEGVAINSGFYNSETSKAYMLLLMPSKYQSYYYLLEHGSSGTYGSGIYKSTPYNVVLSIFGGAISLDYVFRNLLRKKFDICYSGSGRVGSVKFICGIVVETQSTKHDSTDTRPFGIELVEFSIKQNMASTSVFNDQLVISDGKMNVFDGENLYGGLNVVPEFFKDTGGTGAFTWSYILVYKTVDANGNIIRSIPSAPYVQLAATSTRPTENLYVVNKKVLLYASMQRMGAFSVGQKDRFEIEIYTTEVNGGVFYLAHTLFELDNNSYGTNNVPPDASLIGNQILYTTGDVLENLYPETSLMNCEYNGRIWSCDGSDTISFSKEYTPGRAVEFNDGLYVQISGKKIDGIASLRKRLAAFSKDECFAVYGNEPNNAGLGGNMTYERISGTVGCINRDSIVETDVGIFFLDKRMIYSMSLDGALNPVGSSVVDWTTNNTIKRAINNKKTREVLFFCSKSISGSNVLCYNYLFNVWSIWDEYCCNFIDASIMDDRIFHYDTQAGFSQEIEGYKFKKSQSEAGCAGYYSLKLETGWLKVAKINGFQRVYRLHVLGGNLHQIETPTYPEKLKIEIYVDYINTIVQTEYFDLSESGPWFGDRTFDLELHLKQQKCTSMKIVISDDNMRDANSYYDLNAINLIVGTKAGLNKLPVTKKG
jgi:hypothetical protein